MPKKFKFRLPKM